MDISYRDDGEDEVGDIINSVSYGDWYCFRTALTTEYEVVKAEDAEEVEGVGEEGDVRAVDDTGVAKDATKTKPRSKRSPKVLSGLPVSHGTELYMYGANFQNCLVHSMQFRSKAEQERYVETLRNIGKENHQGGKRSATDVEDLEERTAKVPR